MYLASFSGSYRSSIAHLDTLPTYNAYIVQKGGKEVILIPPENSKYLSYANGIDNVYITADRAGRENLEWLNQLPEYYHFELAAGDMLLFNNGAMPHKFFNLVGNEVIYSLRMNHADANTMIVKKEMFNWDFAWHGAKIAIASFYSRDQAYV